MGKRKRRKLFCFDRGQGVVLDMVCWTHNITIIIIIINSKIIISNGGDRSA